MADKIDLIIRVFFVLVWFFNIEHSIFLVLCIIFFKILYRWCSCVFFARLFPVRKRAGAFPPLTLADLYFCCKCCKTVDLKKNKKKTCLQFVVTAILGRRLKCQAIL